MAMIQPQMRSSVFLGMLSFETRLRINLLTLLLGSLAVSTQFGPMATSPRQTLRLSMVIVEMIAWAQLIRMAV